MFELLKKHCFGREISPCPRKITTRIIPNTFAIVAKTEGSRLKENYPLTTR